MGFSSIPAYLDPSNWQQQQPNNQIGSSGSSINPSTLASPPLPPSQPRSQPPSVPPHGGNGSSSGSIRPGSMVDRARMANILMPEAALKCPRCESTNTKFCYFNNYSLTQPRHFCKTCRRYWTKGGALRNVPVGGCCRRNKRNKTTSTSSKSPASSSDNNGQNPSGSTNTVSSNSGISAASLLGLNAQIPPLRFMAPLCHNHHLTTDYGIGDISLNYGGISASLAAGGGVTGEMNFQMGSNFLGSGAVSALLSTGGIKQWRLQQAQQFPSLGGLDSLSPVGTLNYPLHHQTSLESSGYARETSQVRPPKLPASMLTQMASVKVEDNQNSRQQFMGIPWSTEQWSASSWTDLSSFSSSYTSNPL